MQVLLVHVEMSKRELHTTVDTSIGRHNIQLQHPASIKQDRVRSYTYRPTFLFFGTFDC